MKKPWLMVKEKFAIRDAACHCVRGVPSRMCRVIIKQILEVDDASASVYVSLAAARLVSVQITGAVGTTRYGCGAGLHACE